MCRYFLGLRFTRRAWSWMCSLQRSFACHQERFRGSVDTTLLRVPSCTFRVRRREAAGAIGSRSVCPRSPTSGARSKGGDRGSPAGRQPVWPARVIRVAVGSGELCLHFSEHHWNRHIHHRFRRLKNSSREKPPVNGLKEVPQRMGCLVMLTKPRQSTDLAKTWCLLLWVALKMFTVHTSAVVERS